MSNDRPTPQEIKAIAQHRRVNDKPMQEYLRQQTKLSKELDNEAVEKIAKRGQLHFGYVDWDVELDNTKEAWRELAKYAIKLARRDYTRQPTEPAPVLSDEEIGKAWSNCNSSLDFPHSVRQDRAIAQAQRDSDDIYYRTKGMRKFEGGRRCIVDG